MSLGHGPKIVTNSLAFAFDMNSKQSWKGKPTTNFIADAGRDCAAEYSGSSYPFVSQNITSQVQAAWSSSNNTFAMQFEGYREYVDGGSGGGADGYPVMYIYFTDWSWSTTINRTGYEWSHVGKTFTMPDPTGKSVVFAIYHMNSTNRGKSHARNFQIEHGNIVTPFVNGTRSNTEALLDWTSNATITATSPTYNSDNTFTFNSGTERLDISNSIPISNNFSWTAWIRSNNIAQTQNIVSMNGPYFMRLSGSKVRFNILTSGGWLFQNGTTVLSSNTWYNLCMVWNGDANTWTGYINGKQEFSVSKSGTVNYGSLYGYVGYTPQGGEQSYFNGDIPVLYCHNKALTAQEVQQNFNALRGRYGI